MESNYCTNFMPYNLLCEYSRNPLGIDARYPLFSWSMKHNGRGQLQTAYHIIVASNSTILSEGIGDLWDSKKTLSAVSSGVPYGGKPLVSGQCCFWKVKLWDSNGEESGYSDTATFEMGLLEPEDWKGGWMGFAGGLNGSSMLMRKEFELSKNVLKARAYISGLGYYELRLNGQKAGDHVLDPGVTDYGKRILYSTYDVTAMFNGGRNVVGIILGNGWYGVPKALLQMNIEFEDGTWEEISTKWDWGEGWYVARGPIVKNSIFDGEVYDARLERTGWDTSAYDFQKYNHKNNGWITATYTESPGGRLVSQVMEPIKVVSEIEPVKAVQINENVYVYDIGQNMAGWAKIEVTGERGTTISMKYAESLYEDGTVNQENLRLAESKDVYILAGNGKEVYAPKFTYHGFRYVQLEIEGGKAEVIKLTAQVVRSSVEAIGYFDCSNQLINQIHNNVWWTEASNLQSVPTDCPQRDERMAWLNDATARAEEAVYNFDMSRFYQKWIMDIYLTQDEKTGAIADTAPYRWGFRPADPVASCYLTIPLMLYKHYGNKRLLEEHYEGLKNWVRHLENEAENFIVKRSYYGDWASPVVECQKQFEGDGAISKATPGELVSTAYFYLDAVLISKIADILGNHQDKKVYLELAGKIKDAFINNFFDSNTGNYYKGSQGSNSIALRFDLVLEDKIEQVARNLVFDIEQVHDNHLTTGNQCTKPMLEVLAEYGNVETAYKVVTQTTYPSWGFMLANGATTIWERWEKDIGNEMNSRNHPMHANVGSWFYKVLAGISVGENASGFDRIIIKPYPAGDLSFVNASLKTVKGIVEVKWKRDEKEFILHVDIPANASAKVSLPLIFGDAANIAVKEGGECIWKCGNFLNGVNGIHSGISNKNFVEFEVGSGSYCFSSETVN